MKQSNFIGVLYIHKNKINDKCYVGQTTKVNPKHRWGKNGNQYHTQLKFYNAIQKYGWNNFEHMILPVMYNNQNDLDNAEKELIKELNSCDNGYNSTYGGMYPKIEQEVIKRRAKSNSINTSQKVKQYDIDGNYIKTWNSIREVANDLNVSMSSIRGACLGYQKESCGYLWSYENQEPKPYVDYIDNNSQKVAVNQYTLDRVFIKKHLSIGLAAKEVNGSQGNIWFVCQGKRKSHKGYIWEYNEVT
jgi:hypothetical protein